MSSPQLSPLPIPGNLVVAVALAASTYIGAVVDTNSAGSGLTAPSYPFEYDLTVRMTTSATSASTSGLSILAYPIYGSTSLSTGYSSGATSISVASAIGIAKGMKIAVGSDGANGPEIVTVSAISGTTLTVSAFVNNHLSACPVYLIAQTARYTWPTLGQNLTAANITYSATLSMDAGTYFVSAQNLDSSNAVTAEMTLRAIIGAA